MRGNIWDEKTFAWLTNITDPQISSDGNTVAYVLTNFDFQDDKKNSTVVLQSIETGGKSYIENATMPRFSPDGKQLAYLLQTSEPKRAELRLHDMQLNSARELIEAQSIVEFSWRGDNRQLCVVTTRKRNDSHVVFEDDIPVWFNGKGFTDQEKVLISMYDSASGAKLDELESLSLGLDTGIRKAVWFGDTLMYNVPRRENPFGLFDIYAYKDGDEEKVFESVSFRVVASDGRVVVLYGRPKRMNFAEHNYLYSWDGKHLLPLTEELGWDNGSLRMQAAAMDGQGSVYYTASIMGKMPLLVVEKDGKKHPIVEGEAWVKEFDVNRQGFVVLTKETPTQPSEVFLWNGQLLQVTNYNEQVSKKLTLKPLERIEYSSMDQEKIEGWYIRPETEAGEKAPLIVFIHGGPKAMYGYSFDFLGQLFAHRGFYVLYTNPRGSSGYEESFATLILGNYGEDDFKDISNGVDALIAKESNVDSTRIGITGISGGGYLTNWAITHSNRFSAAISENGISNWFSEYAVSDIGNWFCRDYVGANPLDNQDYRRLSPIFSSQSVSTPILFIHSVEDYRCPLDQSIMFYQTLKLLGKEAYIAVFRRGEHDHALNASPVHQAKRHKVMVQFFESKLIKKEPRFVPDLTV